jgi:hypothetical protein
MSAGNRVGCVLFISHFCIKRMDNFRDKKTTGSGGVTIKKP